MIEPRGFSFLTKHRQKRLYFFQAILFAALLFTVSTIEAAADCPNGISGYWKLDETVSGSYFDEIGTNDGFCSGGGCPSSMDGVFGQAQRFDGSTDNIAVDANSRINWGVSQSFTIELWMYRYSTGLSGSEVFISRSDSGGMLWYIGINSAGHAQALLTATNGSTSGLLTGVKVLPINSAVPTWHHVALVRNASQATTTLYIDGVAEVTQSTNFTAGFASQTAPMRMGSLNGANYFEGGLDEVAVYARALSGAEIRSHYYIPRGYCSRYDSPIIIMPMGDSITRGNWNGEDPPEREMVGYRSDLWDLLKANLFWTDYTGSQQNGWAADVAPDFNDAHAGFGGIKADQLRSLLDTGTNPMNSVDLTGGLPYLEAFPADIVLLHIGSNDVNPPSIPDPGDVGDLLDEIDEYSRNVTVLLAKIINQAPPIQAVTDFNAAIETIYLSRVAQGDKIILVDMESESGAGLNFVQDPTNPYTTGDMWDYIHPNPSGYNKMAIEWFQTLDAILPQSDAPPSSSGGGGGGGGCFISTLF